MGNQPWPQFQNRIRQCNTYDMGAEISVDKLKGDCQFVYFRTEFNYQKNVASNKGDVTPNKDQLPVLQQIWKKLLPGRRKILIILYIRWVYN